MNRPLHTVVPAVLLMLGFAGFMLWPLAGSLNSLRFLAEFFVLIGLAQMWNLLAGYGGMVTVGQHLFVGIGAYAFYGLAVLGGWPAPIALAATLGAGAIAAVPAYALTIRLRTAYFAIGTWVLAESVKLMAGKLPGFGRGLGVSLPVDVARAFGASGSLRLTLIYYISLGVVAGVTLGIVLLMRSRFGLALKALRDQESAALVFGVNPHRIKPLVFAAAAAVLALLGGLVTLQKLRIAPETSFNLIDFSVNAMFVVIIGGIGTVTGPIVGAVIFVALRESLADFGPVYLIVLGGVAMALMLIEPAGLAGLARRLARRRVTVRARADAASASS